MSTDDTVNSPHEPTPPALGRWLTLREVASQLSCSESTVRRRCQTGQLTATRASSPFGEHWLIDSASLESELRRGEAPPSRLAEVLHQFGPPPPEGGYGVPRIPLRGQSGEAPPPEAEPPHQIVTQPLHQEPEPAQVAASVPIDAHVALIHALERTQNDARHAERQLLSLQFELQNYRRALSENAESLVEKEAQTQMRLAQEAAMRAECEQLKMKLDQAEVLAVRWQRLPRWVKALFGVRAT